MKIKHTTLSEFQVRIYPTTHNMLLTRVKLEWSIINLFWICWKCF